MSGQGPDYTQLSHMETAMLRTAQSLPTIHIAMSDVHWTGSAAVTTYGRIFTGMNVNHLTGGPCAEQVVLGVAAAHGLQSPGEFNWPAEEDEEHRNRIALEERLACIVAVNNTSVVNPCGKCRQMLFDLQPEIKVLVRIEEGTIDKVVSVPIDQLLPYAHSYIR